MSTDVLVIGGGIAGCATAYFLARAGVQVLVVEKGDLNAGASGANAGSIHLQIPYAEFVSLGEDWARAYAPTLALLMRSVELWKELDATLEEDLEFKATGGIIVARNAEQMRTIERKCAIERAHGVDVRMIDASELRVLAPYVCSAMIGGAYCVGEGKASPLVATRAIARAAARAGASFRTHAEVVALEARNDGYAVRIGGDTLAARRVVNAAGANAGRVAAMLGIDLPVEAFPLQVTATEPIGPLVQHLLYSAANKLTLKQTANGSCLIGGGWPSRLMRDGTLALDQRSLEANLNTAIEAVPALAGARIVRSWPAIVNGTAKWRPLIGQVPGRPGFFLNFFPWMGFTAGPVAALLTAELITGRKPSMNIEQLSALL